MLKFVLTHLLKAKARFLNLELPPRIAQMFVPRLTRKHEPSIFSNECETFYPARLEKDGDYIREYR